MKALFSYLVLPREISQFEREYLRKINRIALAFFLAHLPVFVVIAWANHTGPLLALGLTSLCVVGPLIASRSFDNPRHVSTVFGFTAMTMGALLVHFGQGPMQIEMHFYFFVLIALLAVFANPLVIITAAVTVALHHWVMFLVFPRSVFNYEASVWTVAVHALFVVLESAAACFVARSFFDDVIGLERIVQRRTAALNLRNQDMRLVLDNVDQGFLTVNRDGSLNSEHSTVLDRWFGQLRTSTPIWEYLSRGQQGFSDWFRVSWEALIEDVLPVGLALEQLPQRLIAGAQTFQLHYQPLAAPVGEAFAKLLLVVTDITPQIARERAEAEQRQTVAIFGRLMRDRAGFQAFFSEATSLLDAAVAHAEAPESPELKRALHTLKGNSGLFGLDQVSQLCHRLESTLAEGGSPDFDPLVREWRQVTETVMALSFSEEEDRVEISRQELARVREQLSQGRLSPHAAAAILEQWTFEPAQARLQRLADQISALGRRLGKGQVDVRIEPNHVRLPPARMSSFWSAFGHVVRNAVDHGLEAPEERRAAGKSAAGRISLRTAQTPEGAVVEISDDGRGIDWAAIKQAALRAGLPFETQEHLIAALFADGVTTRRQVSADSGRGIGLAAMRQAWAGWSPSIASAAAERLSVSGCRIRFSSPSQIR